MGFLGWCLYGDLSAAVYSEKETLERLYDELEQEVNDLRDKIDSIREAGIESGIGEGYLVDKSEQLLGEVTAQWAEVARRLAKHKK